MSIEGKKAISSTVFNQISKGILTNNKAAEAIMEKESVGSMVKNANDALKRL